MNNHKKSFPKLVHIYQTMHCNVEENEICILFAFRLGYIDFVPFTAKLKRDCLCRTRLRSNGTTTTSLSLYGSRWQRAHSMGEA